MLKARLRRLIWIGLAALSLTACESHATLGTPCARDSECASPLACRLGRCRTECVETRDCPPASECVPTPGGGSCALSTDRCGEDADCTAPLVCGADGQCRAECLSDADCTDDGHCVLAGRLVCVASMVQRPPPCVAGRNPYFAEGLADWCVELSEGLDPAAVAPVTGGIGGT